MIIRIKKNGMANIIKEFKNKNELFDFVQRDIENTIYSNDDMEKRKWKILNAFDCERFRINELIDMIDYQIIK